MTAAAVRVSGIGVTSADAKLRQILRVDALACAASGVVAAVAASGVADLLGTERTGWVRAVGVFLVVYAADLLLVARATRPTTVRRGAVVSAVGDAVWVAGTVALIAAGAFGGVGIAVVAALGAVVAALGVVKTTTLRD